MERPISHILNDIERAEAMLTEAVQREVRTRVPYRLGQKWAEVQPNLVACRDVSDLKLQILELKCLLHQTQQQVKKRAVDAAAEQRKAKMAKFSDATSRLTLYDQLKPILKELKKAPDVEQTNVAMDSLEAFERDTLLPMLYAKHRGALLTLVEHDYYLCENGCTSDCHGMYHT